MLRELRAEDADAVAALIVGANPEDIGVQDARSRPNAWIANAIVNIPPVQVLDAEAWDNYRTRAAWGGLLRSAAFFSIGQAVWLPRAISGGRSPVRSVASLVRSTRELTSSFANTWRR
jgi:hypothetical protein